MVHRSGDESSFCSDLQKHRQAEVPGENINADRKDACAPAQCVIVLSKNREKHCHSKNLCDTIINNLRGEPNIKAVLSGIPSFQGDAPAV